MPGNFSSGPTQNVWKTSRLSPIPKNLHECISRKSGPEQRHPPVTSARDEMEMLLAVVALEILRHENRIEIKKQEEIKTKSNQIQYQNQRQKPHPLRTPTPQRMGHPGQAQFASPRTRCGRILLHINNTR
jgi:hypothetical protein